VRRYLWRDEALMQRASPFLLVDYHPPFVYPRTSYRRGLPPHPHRGIDTVTLAFSGTLEAEDVRGERCRTGPGDVAWLSAGRGVVHEEFHAADFSRAGGTLEMLQLWINRPAARKMDAPTQRIVAAHAIPQAVSASGAATIRVIAGTYAGLRGAYYPDGPVGIVDCTLAAGGEVVIACGDRETVIALIIAGRVALDDGNVAGDGSLVFGERARGTEVLRACAGGAHVVVVRGTPIGEPIVRDGPFVMTDADAIRHAHADYKSGRLGTS